MRRALLLGLCAVGAALAAEPVTFVGLLGEMTDRAAVTRYPDPYYECRQFSSYDRASKSPADGWFANGDRGQYLREEQHGDRTEWVMADAAGPGAIVRIWSANPSGNLFFYVDGAAEPTWTVDFQQLTGGGGAVPKPLGAERSRGWNCYLPIPYARHIKITSDKNDFYYQVNYRTYARGTKVESFSEALLTRDRAAIDACAATLTQPPAPTGRLIEGSIPVLASSSASETIAADGDGAVLTGLALRVVGVGPEELPEVLRKAVLTVSFDGRDTIFVPLSDFYGSGIGLNPYRTWWNEVTADGWMTCTWPMPFRRRAVLTVLNTSAIAMNVEARAWTEPYRWDDRSMYFGATWRQQWPIDSTEKADWNYIELTGQGVYMGDSLSVTNPTSAWWGEGDEKVYLDGETFPSHFGTGTEDYYGYAWCCPEPFAGPFHAQPRCDGPGNYGHTAVNRVRLLDGIPFARSLRFDMEIWHWRAVQQVNAVTCWFYGKPGLTHNREPQYEEVVRGIPPLPETFVRRGAIEAERLAVIAASPGVETEAQETGGYAGEWSRGVHLWGRARAAGAWVDLKVPVAAPGRYKVTVYGTKSWDYGIVTYHLNGRPTNVSIDGYSAEVAPTGAVELGTVEVTGDSLTLRVEVTGRNPQNREPHFYFGLDCVVLEAAG